LQATPCQKSNLSRACTLFVENTVFIFMQLFLHGQIAEEECRSSRSEIPITLYDPISYLRASLFSGVQGSYDMIT
jgi:hypothetical protein